MLKRWVLVAQLQASRVDRDLRSRVLPAHLHLHVLVAGCASEGAFARAHADWRREAGPVSAHRRRTSSRQPFYHAYRHYQVQ